MTDREQLRRTITVPQGVALYLGAGVLLPGPADTQAGPASLVSWGFDCVLGIPLRSPSPRWPRPVRTRVGLRPTPGRHSARLLAW